MSTATKAKPTAYESKWQEIVATASYGEPVIVRGYTRMSVVKGINDAKRMLAAEGRRSCENGLSTKVLDDGAIRISPKLWQFRTLTDEQKQALIHFAASGMTELFLPSLAPMDVEATLQELSSCYGVELRAEYAVHHLPGGVTDRACWVLKGGV